MSTNNSPLRRREARIEFVGEQDGNIERLLKDALCVEFARFPSIEAAFLARVGFAPSDPVSVALCIFPSSPSDGEIVKSVGEVFRRLFAADIHLDIIFPDADAVADLRAMCNPFFVNSSN